MMLYTWPMFALYITVMLTWLHPGQYSAIGMSAPDAMARPTRPKYFSSPDELKSYLDQLSNYYAIAGRPRFGKRTMTLLVADNSRDESVPSPPPMSENELRQLLEAVGRTEY